MRTITVERGRLFLTILWLVGFILPFVILSLRTFFGTYYGGKETEAWGWFSPNIVPTLGLILATLVASATRKSGKDKSVSLPLFGVTFSISVLYLSFLNLIFILEPLSDSPPLEIFKRSSLFLGVAQGLVTCTMTAFFLRSSNR